MKLIVGLGNPGKEYIDTRHNVGFMVLDKLAQIKDFSFRKSLIFNSYIARKKFLSQEVILLKPLSWMNNSGICVKKVVKRFDLLITRDLLVVYDDVDLELGKMRFRIEGSSAGHRGMNSVIKSLNTDKICRLRIGIGRPKDESKDLSEYVLSNFTSEEREVLNRVFIKAADCCWNWIEKPLDFIMRNYN
ncbi:MAG: aminoacyl-tRNA hydrolase [Candidatus Omnitrophica bacterium]|nr:aminoacyl-tRNA hydrolase [Candidatus Omnitrophota bacterium]MCM8826192.1 aminoacyl-tRNA hydrolase [Candidatus Omnitrophota bacterium]